MKFSFSDYSTTASAAFETEAARDEFAARFPKFVKLTDCKMYSVAYSGSKPGLSFRAKWRSDGTNGGSNEAGMKRLRKLVEILDESEVEFSAIGTSIRTYSEMLDFLKGTS